MMIMLAFMEFIAFPSKENAIFSSTNPKDIETSVSGSLGFRINGKCVQTHANATLISDKKMDWCSNLAKDKNDKPWISYSLKNKKMRLSGFSVRNGCCWYGCCCVDDDKDIDYYCCCELYSFSLQGSNDKTTWKVIHQVEKLEEFPYCKFQTYEFKKSEAFRYIRFVQDEERPGCPYCMQINQIEFYGDVVDSLFDGEVDDDNDDSISII